MTSSHDVLLVYANTCMTWHYFIGLSKIETADLEQLRNHSILNRPFSSWVGYGHETKLYKSYGQPWNEASFYCGLV